MTLHSFPARRVLRRLRGGSSSPVVIETEGGRFVAKLRGSGQGVSALVAEIIVAELAELLELAVPERALIELPSNVPTDDGNDELGDLLRFSVGTNLGFRFLEGAREPRPEELRTLEDEFVARVLWLDDLVVNPDRTAANPNILFWKGRPWLIDHGAALTFHYDWARVTQEAPAEPYDFTAHVFAGRMAALERVRASFADSITREALERATEVVPKSFLSTTSFESVDRVRAAYQAFLWQRVKVRRSWAKAGM